MQQLTLFDIENPCIGICEVDNRGYCKGCLRSREERFHWDQLDNSVKSKVLKLTVQRVKRKLRDDFREVTENALEKAKQANLNISFETEQELKSLLEHDGDFTQASKQTITVLYWMLKNIFLPLFVATVLAPLVTKSYDIVSEKLKGLTTRSQIKTELKKVDTTLLASSYRVIKANNLNLRKSPGKKFETIDTLQMGQIVQVIDSSNKSWLQVNLVKDGVELTGWVYRRYTLKLK